MVRAYRVFSLLRPSRPRHPIAQALFGLFAACAFVVLLVVGLMVAAVMMVAGVLLRALAPVRRVATPAHEGPRGQSDAQSAHGDVIDGEFSVVKRSIPQGTR